MVRRTWGQYSSLSPSPTHLSHITNITLSRIKCERLYFYKEVYSFVHWSSSSCLIMFRIYLYMYVAIQHFTCLQYASSNECYIGWSTFETLLLLRNWVVSHTNLSLVSKGKAELAQSCVFRFIIYSTPHGCTFQMYWCLDIWRAFITSVFTRPLHHEQDFKRFELRVFLLLHRLLYRG